MLYALVLNWLWLTVWPLTAHAVPLVTPAPGAVGAMGLNEPICPNLGNESYSFTIKKGNRTMNLSSNLLIGALLITLLSACQPIQASPAGTEPARVSIPTVTIELGDQGVTVPAELPAGVVAVTVKNSTATPSVDDCGAVVDLIRLAAGKTAADVRAALETGALDPAVATAMGGACVNAGQSVHAIYNLEVGSYLALGSAGEGPPQLVEFTVKAGDNGAVAPQAEIKAELMDFSFSLPDTIQAGPRLWAISNKGQQWHHMSIIRLNEGITIEQLLELVMAEEAPSGPPPAQEMALWEVMSPGVTAWVTIDLPPGDYYVVCFLPDMTANPPMAHISKGMVRTLKVTE
jgi:hypothetical protein